jgi:dTDP-4-amino-4,6-dideoxy-D-galactose acyltransferase
MPPTPADEPCEYLPWDSNFFGIRTARVRGDTLDADRVRRIDDWCARHKVSLLYFLSTADDGQTARCAQDAGFRLVDARVTFERSLAGISASGVDSTIAPFADSDLPALLDIARSSFTASRFYYDGRIPRAKADELFEHWTASSCRGGADAVLVARDQGRPIGYVTCRADRQSEIAHIELIGVAEAYRGRGIGRRLVDAAMSWAAGQGMANLWVVTQGRNVAAQRLYQRCGLVTRSLQLYYHKWYDRP